MLHAPPLDSPAVQLRPPTQLPTLRIPWLYTYVYKATPAIYEYRCLQQLELIVLAQFADTGTI